MKAAVILVVVAVVVIGIVVALVGAANRPAEYEHNVDDVTGPLARYSVSRADEPIRVWREPRHTFTAKDRRELLVGELRPGEVFVVQKCYRNGAILWVNVVKRDDESFKGWIQSPPHEPVHATKLE